MGELEALSAEMAGDVLRSWLRMLDRAEEVYARFDDPMRQWVDDNGHDFAGLVPMLAMLNPGSRQLARALVEDAAGTVDRLSHLRPKVQGAIEHTIAQAKSGGTVDEETYEDRLVRLEQRVDTLVDLLQRFDALTTAVEDLEDWRRSVDLSLETVSVALAPRYRSGTAE